AKKVEEQPLHPKKMHSIRKLEFDKVTFRHNTAAHPALDEISFTTELGDTIAFVGPSGSGKTTLVKLLVGLYSPRQGNIRYNDIDNKEIDFDELRHQIGFVTQDTQLFSGTIKENLLFVKPSATDEQVMDVL